MDLPTNNLFLFSNSCSIRREAVWSRDFCLALSKQITVFGNRSFKALRSVLLLLPEIPFYDSSGRVSYRLIDQRGSNSRLIDNSAFYPIILLALLW